MRGFPKMLSCFSRVKDRRHQSCLMDCFAGFTQFRVFKTSFYLQPLDHGDDLHQGKFLFTGVIVSCGPLILLCCAWTVLVTEFICGMDQLPWILKETDRAVNRSNKQSTAKPQMSPHLSPHTASQACPPRPPRRIKQPLALLTTSMTCVLHLDSSCRPLRARSNSSLYSSSDFWLSRPEPVTTSLLL